MKTKYTKDRLGPLVQQSYSFRQLSNKLGLSSCSAQCHIKQVVQFLDISFAHFTGKLWSKGKSLGYKYPIEDYLSNKRYITSHHLKERLFEEGIKNKQCEKCYCTEWLGNPIPLELNHKNGNKMDNSLVNLEIICPNCHYFTPNYKSKNKNHCKVVIQRGNGAFTV